MTIKTARSKRRRIAILDGPCLGAGAAMALCHFNPDDANNFKSAAANSADASLAQVYFPRLLHAAFSHDSLCLPWC